MRTRPRRTPSVCCSAKWHANESFQIICVFPATDFSQEDKEVLQTPQPSLTLSFNGWFHDYWVHAIKYTHLKTAALFSGLLKLNLPNKTLQTMTCFSKLWMLLVVFTHSHTNVFFLHQCSFVKIQHKLFGHCVFLRLCVLIRNFGHIFY